MRSWHLVQKGYLPEEEGYREDNHNQHYCQNNQVVTDFQYCPLKVALLAVCLDKPVNKSFTTVPDDSSE